MRTVPKVSVLIPTYNYARFLDETIQSVLNQTFTDFELLIVDNRSTDNTDEVVKAYLADTRVAFHKNETNLGLVGNWNRCLKLARGSYIKFLCADDKFHPQLLEKFVAVMERHPAVVIVGSHTEVFGNKSLCRVSPFKGEVSGQKVREVLINTNNRLRNPSAVMFRKRDADKIGDFNPLLHKTLDREYYVRLLSLGNCFIIPQTLSCIRSHPVTESAQLNKKKNELIFEWYRFMKSVQAVTPSTDPVYQALKEGIRKRAIRCAAVLYQVAPKLYHKKHRQAFRQAYNIARQENVLTAPLVYYLKWHYVKKLFGKRHPHKLV